MAERSLHPSGAISIQCESWDDFIQALRQEEGNKPSVGTVYRGHADPGWKLSSAWERLRDEYKDIHPLADARKIFGSTKDASEDDLFISIFKEQIRTMPGIPIDTLKTKEDWWAFGRHFGLVTPLLDWSQSPFIAAFFAFTDRLHIAHIDTENNKSFPGSNKPVVIWRLRISPNLPIEGEFSHIYNTRYEFHRQRIQLGSFTYLNHSQYTNLESYFKSRSLHCLLRYEIPCPSVDVAHLALADLDRMNIHHGTVFPDPQGAAMYANHSKYWFPLGLKALGTIGGSNLTGSIEDVSPELLEQMLKLYED